MTANLCSAGAPRKKALNGSRARAATPGLTLRHPATEPSPERNLHSTRSPRTAFSTYFAASLCFLAALHAPLRPNQLCCFLLSSPFCCRPLHLAQGTPPRQRVFNLYAHSIATEHAASDTHRRLHLLRPLHPQPTHPRPPWVRHCQSRLSIRCVSVLRVRGRVCCTPLPLSLRLASTLCPSRRLHSQTVHLCFANDRANLCMLLSTEIGVRPG